MGGLFSRCDCHNKACGEILEDRDYVFLLPFVSESRAIFFSTWLEGEQEYIDGNKNKFLSGTLPHLRERPISISLSEAISMNPNPYEDGTLWAEVPSFIPDGDSLVASAYHYYFSYEDPICLKLEHILDIEVPEYFTDR